jgi:hypothetical protein
VYNKSLGGINAAWIGVAVLAFGLVLLLLMHSIHARKKQAAAFPEIT